VNFSCPQDDIETDFKSVAVRNALNFTIGETLRFDEELFMRNSNEIEGPAPHFAASSYAHGCDTEG